MQSKQNSTVGRRGRERPTTPAPAPIGEVPKSMLESWLLLLLKTWGGHGYALAEMLSRVGLAGIDHTRVYRELRSLERRGLLLSSWDMASNGPARRIYRLTEAGEEFLAASGEALKAYAKMTAAFVDLYSTGWSSLWRSSMGNPLQAQSKEEAFKKGEPEHGTE